MIPLNDLKRHSKAVASELQKAFTEVCSSGQYILGPWVERFESAFAAYCGVKHAVGVGNGTDALELALAGIDCASGDEVITVANAGGYATSAILRQGARPVYADIDADNFLMTPAGFMHAITPATKAVIVTHLYGLMADMPELCAIAEARGIVVIEDCAQAHGASIAGKKAGAWGRVGCFSFYPTKNLGTIGDAGCIVTNDSALAQRVGHLRQYGWHQTKYCSEEMGQNSRMDALQAAVLLRLLPHLEGWNQKRCRIIQHYRNALPQGLRFQKVEDSGRFVGHLCTARVRRRSDFIRAMQETGIGCDIHYPVPDYVQPAFKKYIAVLPELPVTEQVVSEIISLPCFPEMTDDEVGIVIAAIKRYGQTV